MYQMKVILSLLLGLVVGLPAVATEDPFDGSTPLICAVTQVFSCSVAQSCSETSADEVNLPRFVTIDASNRLVSAAWPAENKKSSEISAVVSGADRLILQGVDVDKAWSATLNKQTGTIVVSQAGDEMSFTVFGVCMPK